MTAGAGEPAITGTAASLPPLGRVVVLGAHILDVLGWPVESIPPDVLRQGSPRDLDRLGGLLASAGWSLPNGDQLARLTGRDDPVAAIRDILALGTGAVAVRCAGRDWARVRRGHHRSRPGARLPATRGARSGRPASGGTELGRGSCRARPQAETEAGWLIGRRWPAPARASGRRTRRCAGGQRRSFPAGCTGITRPARCRPSTRSSCARAGAAMTGADIDLVLTATDEAFAAVRERLSH